MCRDGGAAIHMDIATLIIINYYYRSSNAIMSYNVNVYVIITNNISISSLLQLQQWETSLALYAIGD